jgi:hypothetical protein
MAVISNLTAITLLAAEQEALAATPPFQDGAGTLTALVDQLQEIKAQLAYLNGNLPSGSNKTAIATVITNLA